MSFIKNIIKKNVKNDELMIRDKKKSEINLDNVSEKNIENKEPLQFNIKYLGSTVLTDNIATKDAVRTILHLSKSKKSKCSRIVIKISSNGIVLTNVKSGALVLDIPINSISNCAIDYEKHKIMTFFAMNKENIRECHAFECKNKKLALNLALHIADSFKTAYANWERANIKVVSEACDIIRDTTKNNVINDLPLIDLSEPNDCLSHTMKWVTFDNENDVVDAFCDISPDYRRMSVLPPPLQNNTKKYAFSTNQIKGFNDNFV